MGLFKLVLLCLVATAHICGSRAQNIAPSSLSFGNAPHQQGDVASSPADITQPRTVPAPSLVPVPLPKESNAPVVAPTSPITVQPPAVPSPVGTEPKSSPVTSPPANGQPISPVVSEGPSNKNVPPPQSSDIQAKPPTITINPVFTPPPLAANPPSEEPIVQNPTPSRAVAPAPRNVKANNPPIEQPSIGTPPPLAHAISPVVTEPVTQGTPPVASPPVITEPVIQGTPPVMTEPVTQGTPPVASPPVITEPVIQGTPPVASPPVMTEPVTQRTPPVASPPAITEPVTQGTPPFASPPVMTEPVTQGTPPVPSPPVMTKPITQGMPPVASPPVMTKPVTQGTSPVASPPVMTEPVTQGTPPVASPPVMTKPVTQGTPPVASPPIMTKPATQGTSPVASPPALSSPTKGHAISPVMSKPVMQGTPPVASPPLPPVQTSRIKGSAPVISPTRQEVPQKPVNSAKAPEGARAKPPSEEIWQKSPLITPKFQTHQQRTRKGSISPAFAPSSPPQTITGGTVPKPAPREIGHKKDNRHLAPPRLKEDPSAPSQSPIPSLPAPISTTAKEQPSKSPSISPLISLPAKPTEPPAHPVWTLPPPPPNLDCNYLSCQEPFTDPPNGSPCTCVLPIRVGIRLSIPLHAFFPLVSDFAQEIGSGVKMQLKQVRVMGANVASDQPDETVVLVNLVPLQTQFDNLTALNAYQSFWNKRVGLKDLLFGNYEVLYVIYPGLPSSSPSAQGNPNYEGPFGTSTDSRTMKPLGVDVENKKINKKNNSSVIAIVILSSLAALIVITIIAWLFLLKRTNLSGNTHRFLERNLLPNFGGSTGQVLLGRHSSESGSLCTSITTYSGQAKNFRLAEIECATNYFDQARILGEGGFGCVYKGILEDGTNVAVKVLRRHDGNGEREFLSEVEMLGRLHHRNLVKLIGICAEENARCVVYELVPNGSVESHLHGQDKEGTTLDWNARMKIALGAARGLTYLHEDSSPCVIHRDFKSSNILLDHDFTPKVSDFGLARSDLGEGNQYISTRVMGTFGYVAPEYAMTGHLLVKSDVYSYGVVLLELLTGRKPVDMARPSGQENLVTWARPLLNNLDGLKELTDPGWGPNVLADSIAKVAAIASMCVQPDVSHRPSMSEVVQALKLVCNESNEYKSYSTCSQELMAHARRVMINGSGGEAERVLLSEMLGSPPVYNYSGDFDNGSGSSSFRRYNSSGPLLTGKNRHWQRFRSGSMSDYGTSFGYDTLSEISDKW